MVILREGFDHLSDIDFIYTSYNLFIIPIYGESAILLISLLIEMFIKKFKDQFYFRRGELLWMVKVNVRFMAGAKVLREKEQPIKIGGLIS